jgi:8-amino-7-oxononanoate synthase
VVPVLAGQGAVLIDAQAHKTIYEGAAIARGAGATLYRVRANDPAHLEEVLASVPAGMSRIFCLDGLNSMTGNAPDLALYARICRDNDTLLYVDDAHGFGVIGESPSSEMPYGYRGNSIVRYFGESYDNVVLVAGFSKSYSSLAAFMALPTSLKNYLKVAAAPYLYSGPSPTASLATVLAGFKVNDAEGDQIRTSLRLKTKMVLDQIDRLGLRTLNTSGFPVIELPLGRGDDIDAVGRFLFDRGIYVTLAAYPLVPRAQVGFRAQITAANDDSEIQQLNEVLAELAERFDMQRAQPPGS